MNTCRQLPYAQQPLRFKTYDGWNWIKQWSFKNILMSRSSETHLQLCCPDQYSRSGVGWRRDWLSISEHKTGFHLFQQHFMVPVWNIYLRALTSTRFRFLEWKSCMASFFGFCLDVRLEEKFPGPFNLILLESTRPFEILVFEEHFIWCVI